jgi:hypothetical protein
LTDLYLGLTSPKGKERTWMRTVPGNGYFVILRLYGPTEAAIKSLRLGDVENVANASGDGAAEGGVAAKGG